MSRKYLEKDLKYLPKKPVVLQHLLKRSIVLDETIWLYRMKSLKYMILTLAVNKWKLCLHNVFKGVDGNRKSVANTIKERKFDKTHEEKFMQKVPEILALQTMK